jgi:pantoate--beta-alanine ligase
MKIFDNKSTLQSYLATILNPKTTIGFVPTMGALHAGHLSLLQESVSNNEITVTSIFVNPTQFNNADDLAKYPRTLETDVEKIKTVSDKIIVYAPTVEDVYGNKMIPTHFDYDGLEHQMEGKFRPGHFDGVGTIVKILLETVRPTNAYFGEKDFQQLQIVRKMVVKNNLDTNIVCCSIYREQNGLAMSSRNERLSAKERADAAIIFESLKKAKQMFGVHSNSLKKINDSVTRAINYKENFKLEYFQIADEETLLPCLKRAKKKNFRAFIAVFVNNIRLIDTISLK